MNIGEHLAPKKWINTHAHWLVFECMEQYVICPDNGFYTLLSYYLQVGSCRRVNMGSQVLTHTIEIVNMLIKNGFNEQLGSICTDYEVAKTLRAYVDESNLQGYLVYIDHYGVCISNIDRDTYLQKINGRNARVVIGNRIRIPKISKNYGDVPEKGMGYAMFNTDGYLEAGIFNGAPEHGQSAKQLWGLSIGEKLIVEFY